MTRPVPDLVEGAENPLGVKSVGPTDRRSRHRRRRPPRSGRRFLIALTASLLVACAGAAWVAWDALRAQDELVAASAQVRTLQQQVVSGDRKAAASTLVSLQANASEARDHTHGPHWSVVAAMPRLGPNVQAVQAMSEVVDDLAVKTLPPLMRVTSLVDPSKLAPVKGRINLAPLKEAAPQVLAARVAVQAAGSRLNAIDPVGLHPSVAEPLVDLRTKVAKVAATTATAARAVQLLPPMLGAAGPRQYLLLVQNNAEPRATGGIPGSVVLLRATDGKVEVVEQRTGGSLQNPSASVLPLTAAELALFGEDLGALMVDVTFTPDFPRSAELARAIWKKKVGGNVDGVLSVDPGALAGVLGATGPVKLPTGQVLTAQNAVELLLNTVYLEIADPALQDLFFAATAQSVFAAVIDGHHEPAATVEALAQAAREGRLMVWSAHKQEQALLSGTMLSGQLVGVEGTSPVIGVYLNDGSAAKIGYYLRSDVTATPTQCRADGSQSVKVKVTLTNTAPSNVVDFPPYITGLGKIVPKGEVRTNVLLYAPKGGRVEDVRASNGRTGVFSQTHNGLAVVGKTVQLKPGEQQVIDYNILTGSHQPGTPLLRVTPLTLGKSTVEQGPRC